MVGLLRTSPRMCTRSSACSSSLEICPLLTPASTSSLPFLERAKSLSSEARRASGKAVMPFSSCGWMAVSLLVAAAAYVVMSSSTVESLFLAFPELFLVIIAINIILGQWIGMRLTELFRFRWIVA